MRVTPSLFLPLRRPGVTPWVACPLPLLVVSILTFFPISFLFSFPVRSGGLVWVMGIVLCCKGSVVVPLWFSLVCLRHETGGRDSGFSPGPGGLHLAVPRGKEQHVWCGYYPRRCCYLHHGSVIQ